MMITFSPHSILKHKNILAIARSPSSSHNMASKCKPSPLIPFILLSLVIFYSSLSSSDGAPFKFLERLQGSRKGLKLQEVQELKKYIQRLGYLNSPNNDHDDEFDEALEEAIKTYQFNYHLTPTGTLDSATVSKMMVPRCGVPDISNGRTSMMSGKVAHSPRSSSSINMVSLYEFLPGSPKWPPSKTHLTYAFLNRADVLRPAFAPSFSTWANSTYFTFQETENYGAADIKISFQKGDHGDGSPFDGPGGALAHTFGPPDGRIHVDEDENWSKFNLGRTALHEIGHALGLGHSSVQGSIMYPGIPQGVEGQQKELSEDDIEGIRALYGQKQSPNPSSYVLSCF